MPTDYEREREANIAKNKALLESLGLDQPLFAPKAPKPQPAKKPRKKRTAEVVANEEGGEEHPNKVPRTDENAEGGPRRSQRNRGKVVDYKGEVDKSVSTLAQTRTRGLRGIENDSAPRDSNKRVHNPKTYGHIPGVEAGTWWETRQACSTDAVHAPWVAGIAPGPSGAYSVALSGGYEDDVDLGYAFTYTGSGGRDLKGTKANPKNLRTAPQSSDQDFENNFNKALKKSSETKRPIRVIRGYKLHSEYAPLEGYRYDGLYTVEKAWMERGLNDGGFLVCKFALKRLPGQPPLPSRAVEEEGDNEVERDGVRAQSELTEMNEDASADEDAEGEVDAESEADKENKEDEGVSLKVEGEDETKDEKDEEK